MTWTTDVLSQDLAEWLLGCVAEDEKAARKMDAVYPSPWELIDRGWVAYIKAGAPHFREVVRLDQDVEIEAEWLGDVLSHVLKHEPIRVLADCAAKRELIKLARTIDPLLCPSVGPWAHRPLRLEMLRPLLMSYSDRLGALELLQRIDSHGPGVAYLMPPGREPQDALIEAKQQPETD
jgi:hypothetical protein